MFVVFFFFFFFQAGDGIRGLYVTGVQTCALPISDSDALLSSGRALTRSARALQSPDFGVRFGVRYDPLSPQLPAALTVEFGGEGRNRTDECSFCRAVPYHLPTPPPNSIVKLIRSAQFRGRLSGNQVQVATVRRARRLRL